MGRVIDAFDLPRIAGVARVSTWESRRFIIRVNHAGVVGVAGAKKSRPLDRPVIGGSGGGSSILSQDPDEMPRPADTSRIAIAGLLIVYRLPISTGILRSNRVSTLVTGARLATFSRSLDRREGFCQKAFFEGGRRRRKYRVNWGMMTIRERWSQAVIFTNYC